MTKKCFKLSFIPIKKGIDEQMDDRCCGVSLYINRLGKILKSVDSSKRI